MKKIIRYLFADKQLLKENFILVGLMFAAFVVNYFYHFSMGRLLGPEGFGVIAVLFAIIYLLLAPMNTIQTAISKFVAEYKARGETGKIAYLIRAVSFKLFLYGIAIALAFVMLSSYIADFLNTDSTYVIIFGAYFIFAFLIFGLRGFLQGLQKFKAQGLNFLYESLAKLGLGIVLVLTGYDVAGAIGAIAISVIITALLGFFDLRSILKQPVAQIEKLNITKYAMPMLVALSAVTVLYTIDVIIVKHFFSPVDAGLYSGLALMGKILFFGVMPINYVMFSKIAAAVARGEDPKDLLYRSLGFTLGLAGFGALLYFLIPKLLISLFFGREYVSVTPYLGWFGLIMLTFSASYLLIHYLLAVGKTNFGYYLIVFGLLETAGIWLYHSSFAQVLAVISFIMVSMLAVLLLYYGKTTKAFASHPGV